MLSMRDYVDLEESGFGRVFIVFIERASLAENLELEYRQSIELLDGAPVASLEEAHTKLAQALRENRRVKLVLKRIVARGAGIFGYVERELPVRNLFWVEDKTGLGKPPE